MSKHERAICRLRFVQDANPGKGLGEFNVATDLSNSKSHMILSLYGKESLNRGKTYHAAFYGNAAKILAFRIRFEAERLNAISSKEFDSEYNEWANSYALYIENKSNDSVSESSN